MTLKMKCVTYPLNIEQAWAQGYTGKGVVIAVVDTPVQTDHRDLQGNVVSSVLKYRSFIYTLLFSLYQM
jgi:subtilisin family serine protease